jgi:acyl-coenzyme A synthetase/AMP-(fatty) acid ligase
VNFPPANPRETSNLPFLRGASAPVAYRHGQIITRATFLAEIAELARQLPDRPYIVNLCVDRYRFTVAWAAAMLRAQITLLPTGRDAGSVATLLAGYPALYVLTDDDADDLPGRIVAYPKLSGSISANAVPAFPPDQIGAILFTSGSTGRPNPSPRRWGRLVAGSLAAGAALGIENHSGAALVATVPHAHSYGLESAVMLALQHGLLLTADRPFFPADVAAALTGPQPGVLITTPVHLRALVADAAVPVCNSPVRAGFVLSATAALSVDLAAQAEAVFNAPVFEIYGCSEAGQLATRRTTEGPIWRCLDGFRLRNDAAVTWASGPAEDDTPLADDIELTGPATFILHGRTADMVNVAGKRSSLGYLTQQLTAIEGVEDGVFVMQDDPVANAPARLAAIVVAPTLDAKTILAALRRRIDPAFLPRPLRIVDALPRNVLGKLPRAELIRLVAASPIRLDFASDHPAAAGHFPNDPIVPGAVLLDQLVAALCPTGGFSEIQSAKFHHPVRPGESVMVTHTTEGSAIRFECRLAQTGDALVLTGVLRSTSPSR